MIWFGILYLPALAMILEAMYRAPELEWHGREDVGPQVADPQSE